MKKILKVILLTLFSIYSFAQDVQDVLSLEGIKEINTGDCEFRYPISSFVNSVYKDEILVLSKNFETSRNTIILKGFVININTLESTPITISTTSRILAKNLALVGIKHNEKQLIINLNSSQLIFDKINNDYTFTDIKSYENITGSVHIDGNFTILSRIGKFHPSDPNRLNAIYYLSDSEEKKKLLDIKGFCFNLLQPAQFIDFNNELGVYTDPINYDIYTKYHTKENVLKNNRMPRGWKLTSSMKVNMMNQYTDMGNLGSFLRDLNI